MVDFYVCLCSFVYTCSAHTTCVYRRPVGSKISPINNNTWKTKLTNLNFDTVNQTITHLAQKVIGEAVLHKKFTTPYNNNVAV